MAKLGRRGLAGAALAAAAPAMPVQAQGSASAAAPASAAAAAAAVQAARAPILRICREVWALAELSLQEERSAAIHIRELEAAGFAITSRGTSGYPSAFVAEWTQGQGGPKLGCLPEYDALPGLGNAAEPRQAPTAGNTNGHGCGHNLLGAGCTGGAIALAAMMQQAGTAGTIRVYGCAAEEKEGVKVYMARDGLFDDLDAAIAWHPTPVAVTGLLRSAASNALQVTFHGRTAHAGNSPWQGRSALDALELFTHGVNLMREHVEPTARMHYIITAGGVAPNIVPDHAALMMTIRDQDRARVEATTAWVKELAEGAAMGTQTRAECEVYYGMWDLLPNAPLVGRMLQHMNAVGLDDWTAEEQAFAKACQKESALPERGLATEVMPLLPLTTAGASTDVADISWITPTALFGWPTMPLGTSLHTWPVTACGGMAIGEKGALAAARILAATGFDLMTDAALRAATRADFDQRRGDRRYASPLPPERRVPLNAPGSWTNRGEDQVLGAVQG
jgi:aminobenzoyl-glutamate utilization protein B